MEENKKKNKGLIVLVVLLIICVLGLAGYIIFGKSCDKKSINSDKKDNNTTIKNSNNHNNEKYVDLEINNNDEIDTSNYWYKYQNDYKTIIYRIKSANFAFDIQYSGMNTIFKFDNSEVIKFTPDNYILNRVKKYNNYLFVDLACACDSQSQSYTINMDNKEVFETVCLPSQDGTCENYVYERVSIDSNDKFYDFSYKINYNTGNISKSKIGQFNCNDYKQYSIIGETLDDSGNPVNTNLKKCEDEICERRTSKCFPFEP